MAGRNRTDRHRVAPFRPEGLNAARSAHPGLAGTYGRASLFFAGEQAPAPVCFEQSKISGFAPAVLARFREVQWLENSELDPGQPQLRVDRHELFYLPEKIPPFRSMGFGGAIVSRSIDPAGRLYNSAQLISSDK